ncbi:CIC11C00000001054 [Sungouiella intermedia]|uniref:CIC11C00000001054 n=1 Tax=Sungouiella intermedia TaxID=45354 RepID=A0A1L0BY16_9ASCO|nr:CIC11C00000001054 [[Candida] intermedia]
MSNKYNTLKDGPRLPKLAARSRHNYQISRVSKADLLRQPNRRPPSTPAPNPDIPLDPESHLNVSNSSSSQCLNNPAVLPVIGSHELIEWVPTGYETSSKEETTFVSLATDIPPENITQDTSENSLHQYSPMPIPPRVPEDREFSQKITHQPTRINSQSDSNLSTSHSASNVQPESPIQLALDSHQPAPSQQETEIYRVSDGNLQILRAPKAPQQPQLCSLQIENEDYHPYSTSETNMGIFNQ